MRNLFTTFIFIIIATLSASAQLEIEFSFSNATNTNDGSDDFYEVDVLISTKGSGIDFKLGSGLLYFNYNTAAFGTNVFANGNLEVTHPEGNYILGATNIFPIYKDFIQNDNTDSRFAFSWQQGISSFGYAGNNVTGTAANLFHLKIKYTDVNLTPDFSFEMNPPFDDQTFTACGDHASFGFADCFNFPGTQVINDGFDSSGAALGSLPVEWLSFNAHAIGEQIDLNWATASEVNTSHFEVQRSSNGDDWKTLTHVSASGNSPLQQNYFWKDSHPLSNQNYYRLRQVDLNDQFNFSNIASVFMKPAEHNVNIFPNPTKETFTISFEKEADTVLRLFNSNGALVFEQKINDRTTSIPTTHFPSGVYYVQIPDKGKPQMHKLILLE